MFTDLAALKAAALEDPSFANYAVHLPELHTHSGVSMFATCEQKWFFRYVIGLDSKRIAKHFIVGNLVHLGLESLLKAAKGKADPLEEGDPVENVLSKLDSMFLDECDKIQAKADMLSPADCDTVEYCRVQALAMVKAWAAVKLPKLAEWEVVEVEQKIRSVESQGVSESEKLFWKQAAGMIDTIVRHPKTGKLYVLEHKTRSRMDTFNYGMLTLDQQANWYMSLYEEHRRTMVDGFLYNVIKKPQHRMSAKGSDDLFQRMYKAMLDDVDGYFILEDVIADQGAKFENLRNMVLYTKRMNASTPSSLTRNTSQCSERGGCPYKSVCQSGVAVRSLKSIAGSSEIGQFAFKAVNSELEDEEDA